MVAVVQQVVSKRLVAGRQVLGRPARYSAPVPVQVLTPLMILTPPVIRPPHHSQS